MKKITLLCGAAILLAACHGRHHHPHPPGTTDSGITPDSANKMLASYLNSIDAEHNDSDLHSLIIDADALREYLATDGNSITNVKIMFAHRLDYIQKGHGNVNCGYSKEGLTVILAGYDEKGDYVLMPGNMVINHAIPCPAQCPSEGPAASNLIVDQAR